MSTRGAALKNSKQTKNGSYVLDGILLDEFKKNINDFLSEFSTHHDYNQHCEFCVLSFQTRPDLNAHILTHFKKKTCLQTKKTLLFIAGDWFELHINHGCTSEQCDSEVITDAVYISQQWMKKEENLKENDLDDDEVLSDGGTNSMLMKIESGSEINFDASSSESWSNWSEEKVSKFELTEKESKSKISEADSISSSPAKRKKVISTTKKKSSTLLDGKTSKPVVQPPKSKRMKCRICKLNFTQETITSHLRTRHVPKIDPIPTCETCGKTFSTAGNLRSHQYLHAERGRYICSYCGKEFVRNANLKEHINLHTVNVDKFFR